MTLADLSIAVKPWLLLLLLPPMPMLLLIVVGASLSRHRHAGRSLIAAGVASLWLACSDGAAQWLALNLVATPQALSPAAIEDLRGRQAALGDVAVLVLGGGVRPWVPEYADARLSTLSAERFRYGVWLARQLDAPLGFSGGIGRSARHLDRSEASVAERAAREEYGMPLRWAEGRSRDTRENAALSLPLLRADGVKLLVLVTHDMHMPRALRAFAGGGVGNVDLVPAPVGLYRDAMSELGDWMPSGEGLTRVRYAVYEWLALKAAH